MKKAGQPDSAMNITAGRRIVLNSLVAGTADTEIQAMAANWLRDLYAHYGIPNRVLERNGLYKDLYIRRLHSKTDMNLVHEWITDLVQGILMNHEKAEAKMMMTNDANARQVGGDHYNRRPIQHWDFVAGHDYGYLAGQVTKYLFRWRDKNGVQDVQKADHFLQKLIEVELQHVEEGFVAPSIHEFLSANGIPPDEAYIMAMIHAFQENRNPEFLELAKERLRALLAKAGAPHP